MKKQFKLTKNEKTVLKNLVEQGRLSDTEISKRMPISQQAVYQIRKRLEDLGIIQGYTPIIDFHKLGISMLHFAGIRVLPSLWKQFTEDEVSQKLCEIPFVYMAFRIPTGDISYLLIFGFASVEEEEDFSKHIESTLSEHISIVWSYKSSVRNILANDPLNLVFHALKEKNINIQDSVQSIAKK